MVSTGVLKMEEQIVRTYADMVYRIACRYVKNSIDADDVFSEVFLAYFKKERTFESEEHRKAWLIRVTINCAKDFLVKHSQWQQIHEETIADQASSNTDTYIDLHTAIEQLRPEYREVIKLYYLDDLSVKQIAQILDKNENTIKTQLARAREKLKTLLEGGGCEADCIRTAAQIEWTLSRTKRSGPCFIWGYTAHMRVYIKNTTRRSISYEEAELAENGYDAHYCCADGSRYGDACLRNRAHRNGS